jgi:hypothetical protein
LPVTIAATTVAPAQNFKLTAQRFLDCPIPKLD